MFSFFKAGSSAWVSNHFLLYCSARGYDNVVFPLADIVWVYRPLPADKFAPRHDRTLYIYLPDEAAPRIIAFAHRREAAALLAKSE